LFFSGASLARVSNCPPAAPLKNKKKRHVGRGFYKQATPGGVMALGAIAVVGSHEVQGLCINSAGGFFQVSAWPVHNSAFGSDYREERTYLWSMR
jgi:hypothetical protein